MDTISEYATLAKTCQQVGKLQTFLDPYELSGSTVKYVNIINQNYKRNYFIPFASNHVKCINSQDVDQSMTILDQHLRSMDFNIQYGTAIEEFFALLEECRIQGLLLSFSEQQIFTAPTRVTLAQTDESQNSEAKDELNDNSCIEFDFDIYQKTIERMFNDVHYNTIIQHICDVLYSHLDLSPCVLDGANGFYVALLRKPNVIPWQHKEYGKCFKDSFHIRFFMRVPKKYKQFLLKSLEDTIHLDILLGMSDILNSKSMLDKNSANYSAMLLGSAKCGATVAHSIYKLYICKFNNGTFSVPTVCTDLDNLNTDANKIKVKDIHNPRRKIEKDAPGKYQYNLCYEMSLNFEAPGGLIRKFQVEPHPQLLSDIESTSKRTQDNIISPDEIDEVGRHIADLTVRDYEARYVKEILGILKAERCSDYQSWVSILIMLARANPDYKPLAIWYSQHCPRSWANDGAAQLDGIWEWAQKNNADASFLGNGFDESNLQHRSIKTLYAWAREDNPKKFEEIQEYNAFMKLHGMIHEHAGRLHETHFAKILKVMFGKKFICDENELSITRGSDRRWYEFVFPGDGGKYNHGQLYKWRLERSPDNLQKYISDKMPIYLNKIKKYEEEREKNVQTEEGQKYFAQLKKNLNETIFTLGKDCMIESIIKRCRIEFRERGFIEQLDTDPNIIGVGNGVLRLYPRTELIQHYHEIPITRSTRIDYIDEHIDPATAHEHSNPFVRRLWIEIRRIFADNDDAFEFTMCYLASALDGRKKSPLFFIWLGEGANGKSFILELMIKLLVEVMRGGYGSKMNAAYFTQDARAHGPDSEKMTLKFARFTYCSESEEGDVLRMAKIKEFTSETISGNEKHEKQDMFEAICRFVFCSNNDPRVIGSDWGTWRRVVAYYFKMKFVENPDPNDPLQWKIDYSLVNDIPNDKNYKQAFLSILVYWYGVYRDKYHSNVQSIAKPSIDAATQYYHNSQDTIARFISEQCYHVGKFDPRHHENIEIEPISVTTLAARYADWHKRTIDAVNMQPKQIISLFQQSRLKKFIVRKADGSNYLVEHLVIEINKFHAAEVPILQQALREAAQDNAPQDNAPDDTNDNIAYESLSILEEVSKSS